MKLSSILSVLAISSASATTFVPKAMTTPGRSSQVLNIPRGGGIITGEQYVKATCAIYSVYGIQMLLTPDKLKTDHFEGESTVMEEFAWRGHAATLFAAAYALWISADTEMAPKIALGWVAGIALLYPFNAKFGIFSKEYKPKYPMHYVPEILMTGLLIAGISTQM